MGMVGSASQVLSVAFLMLFQFARSLGRVAYRAAFRLVVVVVKESPPPQNESFYQPPRGNMVAVSELPGCGLLRLHLAYRFFRTRELEASSFPIPRSQTSEALAIRNSSQVGVF